jgi:serine/threonine protein kinase/cephalosporin-C deacetylase-like acetyl esterase
METAGSEAHPRQSQLTTDPMTPERWKQIERLYHAALKLEPGQRAVFLKEGCTCDEDLRREVESLLAHQPPAESVIEASALEFAAKGIAADSDLSTVVLSSKSPNHSRIGQIVSHYRILEKLGEGGMGVVYKAQDLRLERKVALKFLPTHLSPNEEEKERFIREAKAALALDHPNIGTIHEVADTEDGQMFIVMAYYEGETLKQKIESGPLSVKEAVDIAAQIAQGLANAHSQQIVHRDVKPGNVLVTPEGLVKIIDFGLAKLGGLTRITKTHTTMGTVAYMSPEQARGEEVDQRADVWALGVVLYEMLSGQLPFSGTHAEAIIHAILTAKPKPLKQLREDAPAEIDRMIQRALEKDLKSRYASAAEVLKDLSEYQSSLTLPEIGGRRLLSQWIRQKQVAIPGVLLLLAVTASLFWVSVQNSRVHWARNEALPQIARLVEKGNVVAAFRLARQGERYLPGNAEIQGLRRDHSFQLSIRTTPPGADVYVKDYMDVEDPARWELLGRSPLESVQIPASFLHYRITKLGFNTVEGTYWNPNAQVIQFTLDPKGAAPSGMVRVPGGSYYVFPPPIPLQEFWLDKYEVTNKQFKEFVDQGGYQKHEQWKQPFVKDGHVLSWEQAMTEFRDATGRPGPSTWEFGTYTEGRADFPVNGVSWYEAAAYTEFAGKNLPTVYHWYYAARLGGVSDILRLSNFSSQGPAPIGSQQGLGPYGTYDMAGNVKEWCWNLTGTRRYILGGAWSEPSYTFYRPDARSPFDRSATNGFRCAKYAGPLPELLTGPVQLVYRDRRKDKPASDAIFQVYRNLHSYDRTELKPAIESVDDRSQYWRKEKVSFLAAYGNERVIAFLFLPKNVAPPYQTVIFFPGAHALELRSSEKLGMEMRWLDFIIRSGRVLMYPVYKGTYERSLGGSYESYRRQPNVWRDLCIQWSKDLGRSIDYLETRQDIDRKRLAYYGLSLGAYQGPRLTAIEGRFKTSVLLGGGFDVSIAPEVDSLHFAPRSRIPVLMLNGRNDFLFPLETSQIPMFRLLGAPEKDKRHLLFDAGHTVLNQESIKEILNWLDRYLGPVKTTVASSR